MSSEILVDAPDAPDTGMQTLSGGTGSGLLLLDPVAFYMMTYIGSTQFRLATNGPFMFNIFRPDGGNVDMPTINVCTVVKPDGQAVNADLLNPSAPSDPTLPEVSAAVIGGSSMDVYVLYSLPQLGTYKLRLELSWGEVIASTPQEVILTCVN